MKKELDLNGKIRNLQVSISIYKREIKDINQMLPTLEESKKQVKIARLAKIQENIDRKELELIPLKAERELLKSQKVTEIAENLEAANQ